MPSSITIPDRLRKKIKKLAALLDTSQSKIISVAIEDYEKKYFLKSDFDDPEVVSLLNSISKEIYEKFPERRRRAELLSQSVDILDSISPAIWGKEVNE